MLVVGFDLDLTLVDSRPGIRASFEALRGETGVDIDIDLILTRIGPKLAVDLAIDHVVGHVHGDEKRDTLTAREANVYVGDTTTDVTAAIGAGVIAVGVTTGPHDKGQLEAAGADVVLASLEEFPRWLERTPVT